MMNVYDFDKTIYNGDSTLDFYFYCLKKYPNIIICLPKQILGFIKYKCKKISKTQFKEVFYSFLKLIDDIDLEISLFWNINEIKIKKWYLNQQQDDDVVVSASPHFLLEEVCERKNIKWLIASKVNKKTGEYEGLNCYKEEKVKRLNALFPNVIIDNFYSDSISDLPLANNSKNSYIIKGGNVKRWKK